MLALTIIAARMAQFACAMVLFGSALFFIYGLPGRGIGAARGLRWPRPLLLGAAIVLALAAAVSFCTQTAVMTGSIADALDPDSLASVFTDTQFGQAAAVRLALALVAAVVLSIARPSRGLWLLTAVLGAGVVASFAWTGHGSAGEGAGRLAHLVSDVLHLTAAAVWLGALAALCLLLLRTGKTPPPDELGVLHGALKGFSGIGSGVIAVLLATGLVNSWFLIGPSHLAEVFAATYGLVLAAKVGLFGIMLILAAANRFRLTPRLGAALGDATSAAGAVSALRRSILLETLLGALVLVLVSLLGTLAPMSAQ
jgi:putative copper resistance protein D